MKIGLQFSSGGIQSTENKLIKAISSVPKETRLYYDMLLRNESEPNWCSMWVQRLSNEVNWQSTLMKIQRTKDIKLRWFQLRIVHRILGTNVQIRLSLKPISHFVRIRLISVFGKECTFVDEEREK